MTTTMTKHSNSQPASPGTPQERDAVREYSGKELARRLDERHSGERSGHPARDLRWLLALRDGLCQQPWLLETTLGDGTTAVLPLMDVKSFLFGRFLVGMPYLNAGGVDGVDDPAAANRLIDAAVALAERLDCRHLELRHERRIDHPAFNAENGSKVHMRLRLPETSTALWDGLKSKLRSQVRKGLKEDFHVEWGGENLLKPFYDIFSRRMHELGTPVYGRALFESILRHLHGGAEICCLRLGTRPVGAALLVHGGETTEVPSASALTELNSSNANMVMYWHLLARAIERGGRVFDFGRATEGSGTYRFKEQWGAEPSPAIWQYHVRRGSAGDLRPDNEKNRRRIELWKKLPLWLTRWMGPTIVRGIP